MTDRPRIGIIGFGNIGRHVYEAITTRPELDLDIGFVHSRGRQRLADLPPAHVLDDIEGFRDRGVTLVVEVAHPDVTRQHGADILAHCDYMPLSMTCFAHAELEARLVDTSHRAGTRLYIAHGGVVGLDALEEGRDMWDEVSITMRKPVRGFDFSASPEHDPATIETATVLYDGPARGICPKFPRNVNSHAAVAMAGLGFDRTRSVLVADPALEASVIELEARGGGVEMVIHRENPMVGVSGIMTLLSSLASIVRAASPRSGPRVC